MSKSKKRQEHDARVRVSCGCENLYCHSHGLKPCQNAARSGQHMVQDVGEVCKDCYRNIPSEYHLPPSVVAAVLARRALRRATKG